MLAMVVNDNAGCLDARGAWATIASVLAPTGMWGLGYFVEIAPSTSVCASATNCLRCSSPTKLSA